ncbi:EGF-like domain containing protein [Nitzschia inconspicua]|uniref:EGF-like domain containing protein n=1 Tax=Nitzschia inconspicua TaxID=303405 RepID=A0A9K3L6F4_9STRA|nr:EGF-like domain containing protein [Nitzschia inconspicua]KAG7356525.1 EGF-like domain containing protein [Nitzschia inconspicua]
MITIHGCSQNSDCLNGGVCRKEENGSFRCNCPTGYRGERCDPICSLPCQNGGYCTPTDSIGSVTCQCLTGYGGTLCEQSIGKVPPSSPMPAPPKAGGISLNPVSIVAATSAVWLAIFLAVGVLYRHYQRQRGSRTDGVVKGLPDPNVSSIDLTNLPPYEDGIHVDDDVDGHKGVESDENNPTDLVIT